MGRNKACLISGGGAWGAYGGGTLARIDADYDIIVGVSTGSLLAPLVALKEWDRLKSAYTSVNSKNIFDKCWYKGRVINKRGKINKLPIIMTLLLGQKTVCTSNVLRKTIKSSFTIDDFIKLQDMSREIVVGTQNFRELPSKIHYFTSRYESYEDFIDWMWSSASFPFFTSLVKKSWLDDQGNFHVGQWSDGGISDLIGIDELFKKGYKNIDIILHRTKIENKLESTGVHNLTENISTTINAMRHEIEFENFYERIRKLNRQGAKVTVYWLPRKLSENPMIFNKRQMSEWWEEGYKTALDADRIEVFEPIKKRF